MSEDPHKLAVAVNKSQRLVLGVLVLIIVDAIWVTSLELTNYIYQEAAFNKPFFNAYTKASMFSLYLLGLCFWPGWRDQWSAPSSYVFLDPNADDDALYAETSTRLSDPLFVPIKTPDAQERCSSTDSDDSSIRSVRFSRLAEVRHMSEKHANEAHLSRLGYQASVKAREQAKAQANKLSIKAVAKLALCFAFLWFIASYTFQASLSKTKPITVSVLSSISSLLTCFLAAVFPSNSGDKLSVTKLLAVTASTLGCVKIGFSDAQAESGSSSLGIALALVSALAYAVYIVLLKKALNAEDKLDIPMFFGFVGAFSFILLWPCFFLLHYTEAEVFEWPSAYQWTLMLTNGLIGTMLAEVLWLWGCFLTSSLIGTLAISLSVPMSSMIDAALKRIDYPCSSYLGSLVLMLCFFSVCLLSSFDNWDPALDALHKAYSHAFRSGRSLRLPDMDLEASECLISINNEEHEA